MIDNKVRAQGKLHGNEITGRDQHSKVANFVSVTPYIDRSLR